MGRAENESWKRAWENLRDRKIEKGVWIMNYTSEHIDAFRFFARLCLNAPARIVIDFEDGGMHAEIDPDHLMPGDRTNTYILDDGQFRIMGAELKQWNKGKFNA